MHAFVQLGVCRFVAEVVGHVDEVGLLRFDALGGGDGLVEREMRRVVARAEGVEDQCFDAAEQPPGFGRDGGDIGAVGEGEEGVRGVGGFDAETQHRQSSVQQADGREADTEEVQRLVGVEFVRDQCRDERLVDVVRGLEDVLVHAAEVVERVRFGVDVDRRLLHGVEAADLIEAEGVIDVVMGVDDRVAACEAGAEGLLAQVGRGVDQDGAVVPGGIGELQARAGAEAAVARVGRCAHSAGAADEGNARAGACAEEGEAHEGR